MPNRQERKEQIALIQTGPVSFETGLNDAQVAKRQKLGLTNATRGKFSKSYLAIVLINLCNWFNVVLTGVAVAFAILGVGYGDSVYGLTKYGFMLPVVLNLAIGIYQECKAKQVTDKLKILNMPSIKVIRNATLLDIRADKVVTDDLVVLESGMQIPVDGVIVNGSIATDDSLLTGEQKERSKAAGDKVLAGMVVVSGRAHMQTRAVGRETYAQKLRSALAKEVKPHSQMNRGIQIFVLALSILIVPMAIIAGYTAVGHSADMQDIAVQVGTTIVGAIPTGLVLLASARCALSIIALYKEHTTVKELRAVEGLALSQVVCLDKTGTLTTGVMELAGVDWLADDKDQIKRYLSSLLTQVPDKSETAAALRRAYPNKNPYKASQIIPFDSKIKHSGCVFLNDQKHFYGLGAPQFLLPANHPLLAKVAKKANQGLRVIALTKQSLTDKKKIEPLALIYLSEQIRPGAAKIIADLLAAGVKIRIISGDDPTTVSAIARRINIPGAEHQMSLIGKSKLQTAAAARGATIVFGRANPEQKRDLVKSLQSQGYKVAMVIDALNDILAAKAADCSICIAHTGGASAAAQVADVTILDGKFSHVPAIIKEGRKTVNNMERAATLFLMKSFLSLLLAAFTPVFGHLPYTIEGLYLVTWFVTGIGGLLLGLEDSNDQVDGRFVKRVLSKSVPAGLFLFVTVISVQFMVLGGVLPYALVQPHFGTTTPYNGWSPQQWLTFNDYSAVLKTAKESGEMAQLLSSVFFIEEPLCILTASVGALAVMFKACSPVTKFRLLCLGASLLISALALLIFPMYFLGADNIPQSQRLAFMPFYSADVVFGALLRIPLAWSWLVGFALAAIPLYGLIASLSDRFLFKTTAKFYWPLALANWKKDTSIKDSFTSIFRSKYDKSV